MTRSEFVGTVDLDVTLHDAAVDPETSPTRRMVANAAIGMEPEDAYYAARELREALERVHEGVEGGQRKLAAGLANDCDDYQRCLYYALAGRGVSTMTGDLLWLENILEARGRLAAELRTRRMTARPLVNPYAASASTSATRLA